MPRERWSDAELEVFHQEFLKHVADEEKERSQQQEIYDAIFRKGDPDRGIPPGLLITTATISAQLHDLRVWQDRQKTFIGGAAFAVTCMWLFLTEIGHKLLGLLK